MHNFGTLYVYELKKICKRKIVWITMGILIAIAAFMGAAEPLNHAYSITTGQNRVEMNGFEYLAFDKEIAQMQDGRKIDDVLLTEVKEHYQKIDAYQTDTVMDEDTFVENEKQRNRYRRIYRYVSYIMGNNDAVYRIDADTLYQTRMENLQESWTEQLLTEEEKSYWLEIEAAIEKPFIYGYADGWETILEEFLSLNVMLVLAIAICLSAVFSDEHLRKTDALILSSKNGKKSLFFSKMAAGVTFGLGSGVALLLTTILSTLWVYGTEGADIAVQICLPICAWNLTMKQAVLLMSAVYVIAGIFCSIITMFLSEAMKNGIAVMGIMVGSMMATMFVDIPYYFREISQIYELLPTVLLRVWQLWDYRLVNLFGVKLTNMQAAPGIYAAVSILLMALGSRIYKNYQVGGR